MQKLRTKEFGIIALLALVFFFLYSWLYLGDANIFQSPDETANYHFALEFANNLDLSIANEVSDHTYIHPRSVNINSAGEYVPVGFIGMPVIYGGLAKLLGAWSLNVLPAVLAIMAALSFYGLIKQLFSKREALLSFILLLTLAPWWYYSTRGLLPNVSFLSFVLIGLNLLLLSSRPGRSLVYQFTGGLSLGLAFMIRPIEFLWIGLGVLALLIIGKQKVKIRQFWLSIVAFASSALSYIYLNATTYGDPLLTGYDSLAESGEQVSLLSRLLQLLFPFGLAPIESFSRFVVYSVVLLLPIVILSLFGMYFKRKSTVHKKYTAVFLVISIYLILYYGAWGIQDHPDTNRVSIGVSYMRYWLPIYVMSIPFVVWGIDYLVSKKQRAAQLIQVLSLSICLVWSGFVVLRQNDDSIPSLVRSSYRAAMIQEIVLDNTSVDAVIVSQRNDKLFWPKREAIHFQNNDYTFLGGLGSVENLHWYTELPLSHVYDIEKNILAPNNMALGDILSIDEAASLRLIKLNVK